MSRQSLLGRFEKSNGKTVYAHAVEAGDKSNLALDVSVWDVPEGRKTRVTDWHRHRPSRGWYEPDKATMAVADTLTHVQELHEQDFALSYSRFQEAFEVLARDYIRIQTDVVRIGYEVGPVPITSDVGAKLQHMLKEDGFQLVCQDFSLPIRETFPYDNTIWAGEHGVVAICCNSLAETGDSIHLTSVNNDLIRRYLTLWASLRTPEREGTKVSGLFQTPEGIQMRQFEQPVGWPLDRENYVPSILAFYDTVKTELVAPNPVGRLAILDGPSGTGKTYLLRGLVQDLAAKVKFVYVPATMVGQLDGPSMLGTLEDFRERGGKAEAAQPIVMIIEDADECLVERGGDNISSIRSLLNFCDGFLGAMLDIRVLATTNSGHIGRTEKIDKALLRPGRLIARATVDRLDSQFLSDWFSKRAPEAKLTITGNMTLAEAYAKARENGWKP